MEIEGLRSLTTAQLKEKYREVFGEPSRSNHKQFLFRRIAWRIQANAWGGLSERTFQRVVEIAVDADPRIRGAEGLSLIRLALEHRVARIDFSRREERCENHQMKTKLYESLAEWWPVMSAPEEYEEAAAIYGEHLAQLGDAPAKTVLELGSGGGNNAFFLKRQFKMTLVDLSAGMRAHSRRLNPECEHHEGDMRTFRLGSGGQFDRVFIQDAIFYMADLRDLGRAMETAFYHCRAGGALLIAPDFVSETFQPGTEVGGQDGADRSMRYLAWRWDPDPSDHTYLLDFAFLLRDSSGSVRVEHDRHVGGLFPRAEWLRLLREGGFIPANLTFHHSKVDYPLDLFVGVKPLPEPGPSD